MTRSTPSSSRAEALRRQLESASPTRLRAMAGEMGKDESVVANKKGEGGVMMRFHDSDPTSIQRRLDAIAEQEASRRSIALRSIGAMIASIFASLLIMAWGFSMDDADLGPVVFFGGALLGNLGILIALLWAYRANEA